MGDAIATLSGVESSGPMEIPRRAGEHAAITDRCTVCMYVCMVDTIFMCKKPHCLIATVLYYELYLDVAMCLPCLMLGGYRY